MGRGLPPSVRRHGVRVGRVTARSVHSLKSAQVSGIHCVHGAVPPPPLARPSFIPLGSHSHPPPRPWRPLVCCFWGSLSGHWARGKSWRVAFTPGVAARWLGGPTLLRCPGTLRSAGAPAGCLLVSAWGPSAFPLSRRMPPRTSACRLAQDRGSVCPRSVRGSPRQWPTRGVTSLVSCASVCRGAPAILGVWGASPVINGGRHLSTRLLPICGSSLEKFPFGSSAVF